MKKEEEELRCYICCKKKPVKDLLYIGNQTYRCKTHRQKTILAYKGPKMKGGVTVEMDD